MGQVPAMCLFFKMPLFFLALHTFIYILVSFSVEFH